MRTSSPSISKKSSAFHLAPLNVGGFSNDCNECVLWLTVGLFGSTLRMQRSSDAPRLLREQTLTVTFRKPWNFLAETTVAARSAVDDFTPSSKWWRRWELNPRPLPSTRKRVHAFSTFNSRAPHCRWTSHASRLAPSFSFAHGPRDNIRRLTGYRRSDPTSRCHGRNVAVN